MNRNWLEKKTITIAIVVPDNGSSLNLSGILDAFLEANAQSEGKANYDVRIISTVKSLSIKVNGIKVIADASIADTGLSFDTVLITGTPYYYKADKSKQLIRWLQQQIPQARRYGSTCTGAFFLGAAGLLDGHQVTTRRESTAELAKYFPAATVITDFICVKDGNLYTSAGTTAGISLSITLIAEDYGEALASKVAQQLLTPYPSNKKTTDNNVQTIKDKRILTIYHWILDNISMELPLNQLAEKVAMSERNFRRIFQKETGKTPADFIECIRVKAAQKILKESDISLQRVAIQCGFSNTDTMRRAFIRRTNLSPTSYRTKFRESLQPA